MKYQQLGKSDLPVSRIGAGCMSLGKNEAEAARLIHRALEGGINYFDTADMYDKGFNEEMLGRILRGRRDRVVLATKVGNQWRSDGSGWDWNPRKDYILSAVEDSLRRLQTDRIDLYQLHGGTIDDPIDETIEAFEQLVAQGKIRYYGLSSIRPNVIREYSRRSGIISVMMQYSLLDRRPEESCLADLMQRNIGVLARGGLAKGLLAGKDAIEYLNYGVDNVEKLAAVVDVCSGPDRSPAQTALQFVLRNRAITSAVTGFRTMEQLEEVLKTPETPGLTTEETRILSGVVDQNYYDQHR
jgi:aryl-alcohol dehydrogenase-like predicted oxidoreductase